MCWNSDERYLLDLAGRGVAVVPTRFLEPDGPCGEEDFRAADALRHARMLLDQGRSVMVQPYQRLVEEGERALVFVAGTFSHAIRKGPVLTQPGVIDNDRVPHPDVTPYRPTEEEIATALAALAAVPSSGSPLFARVDLAFDDARKPVVMELELIEPNLFLGHHPQALGRSVEATAAEARRAAS
ncbi:hypothetical protein ACFQ0T_41650 [Kitasatospora gansuensis]